MTTVITSDVLTLSVDTDLVTVDQGYGGAIRQGWPCALLPEDAPSVADRQSNPTAAEILPQILALTPRGPAWGTDEAGDGKGASPWMRRVWTAVAGWVAGVNAREFEVATQAFPSAITFALPDWEAELGLPDPCFKGGAGAAARIAAVRARFGALGGQSPAYFICLAKAIGYDISIEEPTQFLVDVSELGPDPLREDWFLIDEGEAAGDSVVETWFLIDEGEIDGDPIEGFRVAPEGDGTPLEDFALVPLDEGLDLDEVADETVWKYWIVNVASFGETWFRIDEGQIDYDPLEGFNTADDLECLLNRYAPLHTRLVFSYALA